MAMTETLIGIATTLGLAALGGVLRIHGRVTRLEAQRTSDAEHAAEFRSSTNERLVEIRDDVKGIGTKVDTLILSLTKGAN